MKTQFLSLVILVALALIDFTYGIQTATNTVQVTQDYKVSWFVHDDSGDLRISFTLELMNYDYSWWGTSGSDGLWLGMGLGSRDMLGADMLMCEFKFTNSSSDEFVCWDKFSNGF